VRRVLGDPVAMCLWLALPLAGAVAALLLGHPGWAVIGWAAGGVVAVVLIAVKLRPRLRGH